MKIQFTTVFLSAMLCAGNSFAQQKTYTPADFIGTWVADEVIGYGEISGGPPYAKEMLGTRLIVTANSIKFGKDLCKSATNFTVTEVDSKKDLENNFGASSDDLGFPAKVNEFGNERCGPVYKFDKYRVVYGHTGVIFRAIQSRPKS